jgi:hypothetical protein
MDADIRKLSNAVIGEIFNALGFSKTGAAYRSFGWLFRRAADRLSTLFVTMDRMIVSDGFPQATTWMLPHWCHTVTGRGCQTVPHTGPLLIISNHAGTYDSFVISSQVGRNDLKIIASDVPFLKNLPNASAHLIYLSDEIEDRMTAARAGMRHLKAGGALLLFGTGLIDPDPAVYPDAEAWIGKWLPSIDLFLRAAPDAQVVVSIVSGVVAERWAHHPITRLKSIDWQKRRLAEFSQVLQQLFFPGSLYLDPCISFAPPVGMEELLAGSSSDRVHPAIILRGKALLADHINWVGTTKTG